MIGLLRKFFRSPPMIIIYFIEFFCYLQENDTVLVNIQYGDL